MKTYITRQGVLKDSKNRTGGLQRLGVVKMISLILCIAFLIAALAACGNGDDYDGEEEPGGVSDDALHGDGSDDVGSDDPDGDETENEVPEPLPEMSEQLAENLGASITTFNRNDIMISAGDQHITWADLYVFIFGTVANLTGFFETTVDWFDEVFGEMTLADMVLEQAAEQAIAFLTYRYGAMRLGVSLSQDDIDEISAELQDIAGHYGGHEELVRALRWQYGFYDFETFKNLIMTEALLGVIVNELYGELGTELPDEIVADFAEQGGYMMAKHILVRATEDDSARDAIDEIYELLRPRADYADFEDFFSELMLEYSEDPGSIANPEGYLFQQWDMVEPFSNATMQLLPGEMSDVVETSHGYHIILRIPLNYDAVPISLAGPGQAPTLRQLAAGDNFGSVALDWREEMNVEFSELFDSINIARIFGWLED